MTQSSTHYTVLSLPESLSPVHPNYQTTLKKAYHRTLLRCHPDKLPSGGVTLTTANHHDEPALSNGNEIYTIDQINTAYKILSSVSLRQAYDASLRESQQNGTHRRGEQQPDESFKTGLDVIDLDDMIYHPIEGADDAGGRFTRSCRCGADEGYVLTEEDMEEVEDEISKTAGQRGSKARSMVIGCLGCSLWVQVDWAVCESDEE